MIYHTDEFGKNLYYQLASVDLKGEGFRTHIVFDYMPQRFKINNGKIYVEYHNFDTKENYIEIYNRNFELESTQYFDYISNFYTNHGNLVVVEDLSVLYDSNQVKITNAIDWITKDDFKGTGIIQIEDRQLSFENKTVQFVNDKYFYVSSNTYPQTYERYYLNGKLDKSIVIGDHIEGAGRVGGFVEGDFSYIQVLKDENTVYGFSNISDPKVFEVNFETGTCNYINQ